MVNQGIIYSTYNSDKIPIINSKHIFFHGYVSQISCNDFVNRAPPGCTQWHRGNSGNGQIKTFNYDQGLHLANQHQIMCVR